jgi:hypothetical protein
MKKKSIAKEVGTTAGQAVAQPKKNQKAARSPRRARSAPAKGKAAMKATPAKKTATAARQAAPGAAREGSKTAKVLALLNQPGGVAASALMQATGWQPHSVRGFLSGTVGKKMGLRVVSTKAESGERVYSIEA